MALKDKLMTLEDFKAVRDVDVASNSAQFTEIKADLEDLEDAVSGISGGLTTEIKTALLDLFDHVAYEGTDGQSYYDALVTAFDNAAEAESIAVTFSGTNETFYDTDSLDVLRDYLTVTATFESGRTRTVTDYRLTGSMSIGTNTITVSYGGQTATFSVTAIWGFKLRDSFVSTGTNKIDTTKQLGAGKYTMAYEIAISQFTDPTRFAISNGTTGSYVAQSISHSNWDNKNNIWGFGITWGNGNGASFAVANHVLRCVVSWNNASATSTAATMQLKDKTTSGTVQTFSNTYSHEGSFLNNITLGDVDDNDVGFKGTLSEFIFENREWSSSEISSFLAG